MLRRGIKLAAFGLALLLFTMSLAITTPAYAWTITLYEGNGAQQDVLEVYPDKPNISQKVNPNDEARSLVLNDVEPYTTIRVFDDPSGAKDDDYTIIKVRNSRPNLVVGTFENSFDNGDVSVQHYHKNGLDGKVSYIEIEKF